MRTRGAAGSTTGRVRVRPIEAVVSKIGVSCADPVESRSAPEQPHPRPSCPGKSRILVASVAGASAKNTLLNTALGPSQAFPKPKMDSGVIWCGGGYG